MVHIGIAHATGLAKVPVRSAFAEFWPEAEISEFEDSDLPAMRATAAGETPEIQRRIAALADQASDAGVDALLFTCSAFGHSIDLVAARLSIPVMKPNEAMFREALLTGGRVGIVATFAPSLQSMSREYAEIAREVGGSPELQVVCAEGAMSAALSGNSWKHDNLIAEAAGSLGKCDAIMLAQLSMTSACDAVRDLTGVEPLTSPASAVRMLRFMIGEQARAASLQAL
ncbi:MAG: aspartate/glutamate racemase family protein [Rhodospirillales bacterium]